jgi:hypothetical protein
MDTGSRSIVFVASETRLRLPTNVGYVHEVSRSIGVDGKIQRSIRLDAMEQAWNKYGMNASLRRVRNKVAPSAICDVVDA